MKRITISTGFITNSSSVVHHFDKTLLMDPEVAAFIERYGLENGRIGRNLWHRGQCGSLLISEAQKAEARKRFVENQHNPSDPWKFPEISDDETQMVVIYGDDYETFASELCSLLRRAMERAGREYEYGVSYN